MKKFKVSGIYTEYIYAETEEEAIEQFDELMDGVVIDPFDEVVWEEMPLSHEKV
jgi:hypothetical protein